MPLLDFIIPEYNTKQELLVRALNSINKQKNIDFKEIGIIIVSDGSKVKYKKSWFKQRFPKLNITYYPKEVNEGPGLTRQYGIDRSEAKYITFLDSDDELYENDNLSKVLNALKSSEPNIIFTNFIEEASFDGKIYVKAHRPANYHTLHGLIVKMDFIKENDIKFSNQIKFQEDTYYADILVYGYDCSYLDVNLYLWKYNETSLVRKDSKTINWNIKIIEDYIKAGRLVYEKLKSLNKDVRHRQIMTCIYGAYLILQSDGFKEFPERKEINMKNLIQLFNEIKDDSYVVFSKEEKKEMYDLQYNVTSQSIVVNYNPTFEEFMNIND